MGCDRAQAGSADEPAVCPGAVVDLPHTGVGVVASIDDRADVSVDGAAAVVVEVVVACGCRQEQQCLAEGVELELLLTQLPTRSWPPG